MEISGIKQTPSFGSQNGNHNAAESPVSLKVARFVQYPKLCFEKVIVGKKKSIELPIKNLNKHDVCITIDQLHIDSGFQVEENEFYDNTLQKFVLFLEPNSIKSIIVSWSPSKSGNVRQVMNIHWEGGSKLQAILLGHAMESKTRRSSVKKISKQPFQKDKQPEIHKKSPLRHVLAPIQPSTPIRRTTFLVKKPDSNEKENDTIVRPPSVSPISFEKKGICKNVKKLSPPNKVSPKDKRDVYNNEPSKLAKRDLFTGRKGSVSGKSNSLKSQLAGKTKMASDDTNNIRKGLAMKKLKLIKKDRKASLPRHPLPYAAKNMFYDERWVEKQERGFSNWLNFILTPQTEDNSEGDSDRRETYTVSMHSKQPIAPSKEDLSFKAYSMRRKMTRLRRSACTCYHTEHFAAIIHKIEREVECGMLAVRLEKRIEADLGIKNHILQLLLSYNSLWLRIGLEVVFGEIILLHSNNDINNISKFINTRLLSNPDISKKFSHPTVPNLYKPGYEEALAKFTLKKFLLLVLFLDYIKSKRLIEHNPCLFNKNASVKTSRDLLLIFSRDYLKGEGDLIKHFNYMGFTVSHVQTSLDEYDFGVKNLAVDLRDGVRLVRLVEMLLSDWSLSQKVRLPAVSRLQKVHNVAIALTALKNHGLNIEPDAKSIVDGHREKTLVLLWQIIFHFQVGLLLDVEKLKDEIVYLKKIVDLRKEMSLAQYESQLNSSSNRESLENQIYMKSDRLNLLLKWSRLICAYYDVKIENFTVSFSDGIAFCCLINFYHPDILPKSLINHETTVTRSIANQEADEEDDFLFDNWTKDFSPRTGVNRKLDTLLSNEKGNFRVLNEAIEELGGIPWLVKANDMSNTIPDEKVVITFVSYLCSRLLNIKDETQAARKIQFAWKQFMWRKQKTDFKVQEEAAIVIQRAVRDYLNYVRWIHNEAAAITIQRAWREYAVVLEEERLLKQHYWEIENEAAMKIQRCFREYMSRMDYFYYRGCIVCCQSVVKGWIQRLRYTRQRNAVILIQRMYRASLEASRVRYIFLQQKSSAIVIQRAFRFYQVRKCKRNQCATRIQHAWRLFTQKKDKRSRDAITIQSFFRMVREKKKYAKQKSAVRTIENCYKNWKLSCETHDDFLEKKYNATKIQRFVRACRLQKEARQNYINVLENVRKIQRWYKSYLITNNIRQNFILMKNGACKIHIWYYNIIQNRRIKNAAIRIQRYWRLHRLGVETRSKYLKMRAAATILTAYFKMYLLRSQFQNVKANVLKIQNWYRRIIEMREAKEAIMLQTESAVIIQVCYRRYKAKQEFLKYKTAVNKIKLSYKAYLRMKKEREIFLQLKNIVVLCQSHYRGKKEQLIFFKKKLAAIKIQGTFRMYLQRKKLLLLLHAVKKLQAFARMIDTRSRFLSLRNATILFQSLARRNFQQNTFMRKKMAVRKIEAIYSKYKGRKKLQIENEAAINIQFFYRAYYCRKQFKLKKQSAILIQKYWRCYNTQARYLASRNAVTTLQSYCRMRQCRKQYLKTKNAIIKVQSIWRGQYQHNKYLETRKLVIKMQSCIRMFLTRTVFKRKLYAVIKIQSCYKMWIQRRDYLRLKHSCLEIQSFVRMCKQRALFKRKLVLIVFLQSNIRMQQSQKLYLKQKDSVMKLQRFWRNKMEKRRDASILIQRVYRGYHTRKQIKDETKAAMVIQNVYRDYVARQQNKRIQATNVIQSQWRIYQAKRYLEDFEQQKNAVLKIESTWLMYRDKLRFENVRHSIIIIQSFMRSVLSRQVSRKRKSAVMRLEEFALMVIQRARFLKMKESAIIIQSRYRTYAQRKRYINVRQAVVTIQKYSKQYISKKNDIEIKKSLQLQNEKARLIQSYYRMYKLRSQFLRQKKAVTVIQLRYRAYCKGAKVYYQYHMLRGALITIQSLAKGYLQRTVFLNLRKNCIIIQSWYRMISCRRQFKSEKYAAIKIQSFIRQCRLRKNYSMLKELVTEIQRQFRKVKAAKIQKEYTLRNNSALKLQGFFKIISAKKCLSSLRHIEITNRRENNAAITIQRFFFFVAAKNKLHKLQLERELFIKKHSNARKIQSVFRMYVQKKQYASQVKAATKIQTQFRSWMAYKRYHQLKQCCIFVQEKYRANVAMETDRQLYIQQRKNVIILQSYLRMFLIYRDYIRKRKAVKVIQYWFRDLRKSKEVRMTYLTTRKSVLVIQKCYRQYVAYKKIKEQRACSIITNFLRTCVHRSDFLRKRQAVILLQRRWRSYQSRFEFIRKKLAVIQIQNWYSQFKLVQNCRRGFLLQKTAVSIVINAYKTYKFRSSVRINMSCLLRRNCAASIIQRCYHRHLIRKREKQQIQLEHNAASLIQNVYRRHIRNVQHKNENEAAIVVQRFYRRQKHLHQRKLLLKKRRAHLQIFITSCRKCLAVLQIQQWHRNLLKKKLLKKERKINQCATRIQALWRGYRLRRSIKDKKLQEARRKISVANANVTEPMKLCNRTKSALAYLLHVKNLSTVHETLQNLDIATLLSFRCCEQLMKDNALPIIFRIVNFGNRSLPWISIKQVAFSILLNMAKCPTTYKHVYTQENALTIITEQMANFRDKKAFIFPMACNLLTVLCHDESIRTDIISKPKFTEKLLGFYRLALRKQQLDSKRNMVSKMKDQQYSSTSWHRRASSINTRDPLSAIVQLVKKLDLMKI